ncbi:hypothetical protein QR680_006034 [Steinernema hermaphroditum]|uniref:NR LBD domain-containing protein n=1 Tax=Steinernema hermaphroditum TaxID=289476 RepID=A0AA39HW97_9BILA|nr:hypothetical protein QR680_006034 [Steinernema hermaphroditum]
MLTNAAKFAMSFEEFASLELDEKWQLYRNFAFYVNDIMTSVHTCNVLGYESRNKLICAGQYCYDPRELEVFDDSIAAEDLEKINNVYKSFFQIRYKAILPCFQLLQPSSTEICFLLAELLWSIEDNSSNNLKSAQGRFMERVLNEMHDYYAKELKIENYAKRLFKLYDYVFALRELGGTRRSACEVTDIFKHIHQPRTECFEYFIIIDVSLVHSAHLPQTITINLFVCTHTLIKRAPTSADASTIRVSIANRIPVFSSRSTAIACPRLRAVSRVCAFCSCPATIDRSACNHLLQVDVIVQNLDDSGRRPLPRVRESSTRRPLRCLLMPRLCRLLQKNDRHREELFVPEGYQELSGFQRYRKCIQVGMVFNENATPSTSTSPRSSDIDRAPSDAADPPTKAALLPDITISENRVNYDFQPLLDIISETLSGEKLRVGPSDGQVRYSPLLTLHYAFRHIDPDVVCTAPQLPHVKKVDLKILFREMEHFFIRVSKFAMCCKEFADLPGPDKWQVYRRSASILFYVVKPYWTLKKFGTDLNDRRFCLGESWYIDVQNFEYHAVEFSQKCSDEMNRLFKPFTDMMYQTVLTPMRELHITEKELLFLLAHTLWNVKGVPGLSAQTVEVAERFVDEVTSELHNYYVYEMRMDSYAVRLTKLVKLLANFEKIYSYKIETIEIAKMFDVFHWSLFSTGYF